MSILVEAIDELLTTHRIVDISAIRCMCGWKPEDPPLVQAQQLAHRRHQAEVIAAALGG